MENERVEAVVIVEESPGEFQEIRQQEANEMVQEPELKGLGGWLILVGFGRVVSVLQSISIFITTFLPFFTDGTLEELTSPISQAYSPLWRPIIYFECVGNLIMLGLHIALLVLFFMRKRLFPKLFIGTYIFIFAFAIIDALILQYLQSTIELDLNVDAFAEIFQVLGVVVIWVPYMLKSVRVKNTFVQ